MQLLDVVAFTLKIYVIENDMTVRAKWTAKQFTVSWNPAAGCIITVSRTSSPIANAPTGTLSNGAAIYYGDMLTIAYAAASGYQLTNHGITSATVSDNITAGSIYASAALIGVYVTTANYDDGKYVCKMEIRNVNGHPYFRGWIYNKKVDKYDKIEDRKRRNKKCLQKIQNTPRNISKQ